jgi:hypothetical protein
MQLNISWFQTLALTLPLASGFALGAAGCADEDPSCSVGSSGCSCYPDNTCLVGLSCMSGICVQLGGEGETGDGDDESGSGDGDGDSGPGDGDGDSGPGDGDGDAGDGDGDGDGDAGDGDGDPISQCNGPVVTLYSQGDPNLADYGIYANAWTNFNYQSVEVADDFVVPEEDGCWCITEIQARGYLNPNIPGNQPEYIFEIYDGGDMVPTGDPIASGKGPAEVSMGDHTATLDMEAVIPAGTHWLSFRSANYSPQPDWFWACTDTTPGDMAVMRDTGSLVLDGVCTEWTPAEVCFNGEVPPEPYQLSVQFDIIGVVGGDDCD